MRKCGFRDCNNQIKWKEEACDECLYRKENHKCDACLQDQGYNLVLLGNNVFRDFINDTEIMLQRTRKIFAKIPSRLHHLLREMEQSLVLTEEEKQALVKRKNLWIDFLRKKNQGQKRDNFHSIKLCREHFDELAEEDSNFIENNLDVKKIKEKWDKNQENHLRIFKEIDRKIGREKYDKIVEELEQEIKEEFPKEDLEDDKKQEPKNSNELKIMNKLFNVFYNTIEALEEYIEKIGYSGFKKQIFDKSINSPDRSPEDLADDFLSQLYCLNAMVMIYRKKKKKKKKKITKKFKKNFTNELMRLELNPKTVLKS